MPTPSASGSAPTAFLQTKWRDSFTPPDQREIWEWFAQEGELPETYAVTGRLDIDTCPMIKGPLQALRNPLVRHVICMCGVQCLKTLIGEMWLLWSIVNDPGPTQWLQNTDQEAREHALERFIPLIEKFPAVHRFYTENRHDKTSTFIRFKHMFLRMEGAETRSNLQRKSIKNQMRSEAWQSRYWPPGTLKEADSRLTQFVHNSKQFTESQPGDDYELETDDMHATWRRGDQNIWHFPCQACRRLQPFHWGHLRADGTRAAIRWDISERTRRPSGEWRWSELVPTIRYECIYCGERHYDDPLVRRRMTAGADHLPQNPDADPSERSYAWNQLAMPTLSWYKTKIGGVYNFLQAHDQAKRGVEQPLKEFFQKVINEPYNPARHGVFHRLETIEIHSPPDAAGIIQHAGISFLHRLMAIDVQADHLWLLTEAWSQAGDSLTLWFEKVFTWDEALQRQKKFLVPDENVLVDVSHRRHEVIAECTRHGHWGLDHQKRKTWICWRAAQGSDQDSFTWLPRAGPQKGQKISLPYTWPAPIGDPCAGLPMRDPRRLEFQGRACRIYTWSNPTIKDIAIARRDGRAKAIQNLTARGDWNEEFSRQVHSQKKQFVTGKFGGGKWKWEKFRDDHGFDCRCMNLVRAFQLHLIGPSPEPPSET